MAISPGQYKGKAIKGSVQFGETDKGTLQIAIDLDVKDAEGKSLGAMTTFLFFSGDAAPYSYERLKALGWKGEGPDEIKNMDTIDANDVDVRVTQPESYVKDGQTKMGSSKLEILTGSGQVKVSKPIDVNTFAARLKAIGGNAAGAGKPAVAGGGDGVKPPF